MEKVVERSRLLLLPEFLKSKKYWQQQLNRKKEETRLPYSYDLANGYEEQRVGIRIDSRLFAQLERASKGDLDTLFIILVASYRVLLNKYTGQRDLQLGIPTMVRQDQVHIFFTDQLLPVDNALIPDINFRELLSTEKERIDDAYQHQHYPLDVLEIYRCPKTAIFLKNIHGFYKPTELDMVLERSNHVLEIQCIYNAKLFSRNFIDIFVEKFKYAVHTLLNCSVVPIDEISLLGH